MKPIIDRMRSKHNIEDDAHVGVKWCESKAEINAAQRLVTAIANTAAVDLADEVVMPEGALLNDQKQPEYFSQSRAIFLNHDYDELPIGSMRTVALRNGAWVCQFYVTDKTDAGRDAFLLMQEGIIRGVSIGFKALDWGRPTQDEINKFGPVSSVIRKWLWLELSPTPIPCNPTAWITDIKSAEPADEVCKELNRMVAGGYIGRKTLKSLGVPTVPDIKKRTIFIV